MSYITATTDLAGVDIVMEVTDVSYIKNHGFTDIEVEFQSNGNYCVSAKCPAGWTRSRLNDDDHIPFYETLKFLPQ